MIKDKQGFISGGRFYKGNLHSHTNQSDGLPSPAQRAEEYRSAGYDFLALTDHDWYSNFTEFSDENFLLLPGTELSIPPNGGDALYYHIVGIGLPGKNTLPHGPVQDIPRNVADGIAFLKSHGNLAIAAHPSWLQMEMDAFMDLDVVGFEVYNSICQEHCGTGFSDAYADHAMRRGRYPLMFAADDCHGECDVHAPDRFLGFIRVKAEALTHEAIVDAILAGSFYASYDGPEILDYCIEDGKVIVETTPCRQICLYSPRTTGTTQRSYTDDLTRAEFPLQGNEQCVRVVARDKNGHCSWTQLLTVEEI